MKTIHARHMQLTKMRIRKTKKVLYIVSKVFFPTILHTRFYPSPSIFTTFHPYISFPLHPAFTPSLRCTSLHFPSLHFTTLFYASRWFSLHFTSLPLTTLFNDFPHTLFFFNSPQYSLVTSIINLLKPTGYTMHQNV